MIVSHEDRYVVSFDDPSYALVYVFHALTGRRDRMLTLANPIGEVREGRPQGEPKDSQIGLLLTYPKSDVERFLKWQRGDVKSPKMGKKKK